jgi:putative phosphoesterase
MSAMRVVAISDTHVSPNKVDRVVEKLRPYVQNADHILHAGDITSYELIEKLARIAPIDAVAGNMDALDVKSRLPEKTIVELAGFKIGLIHGWGSPYKLGDKVISKFVDDNQNPFVDVIVFGHSHRAQVEPRGKILLINPGSAADRMFGKISSLAILKIDKKIEAEIIKI